MNGAETLIRTLVENGIDTCFTNPGTSEMQFVASLDRVDGMRAILGLFEGVVSGAADGYGRMADKPAATLLHLGPGLGNAIANFHNARKAHTPIVNIVGDHATYHLKYDAPLTSDIAGIAGPVSGWVKSCPNAGEIARYTVEAIQAALQPPGQPATLILPADTAWNEANGLAAPLPTPERLRVAASAVEDAAAALRTGEPAIILLNGPALREPGLSAAGRIATATGAKLVANTFYSRIERGAGRTAVDRLPYFAEEAIEMLNGTKHLILAGAVAPVSFFAYPNVPSWLTPEDCEIVNLAGPADDAAAALQDLADALDAPADGTLIQELDRPDLPTGELNPRSIAMTIGALMPENAIVSDEGNTSGGPLLEATAGTPPHDWMVVTGGSIGQGLPVATGAAVACPDRKVICLEADGSAMYTLQALWTQAREGLDVTTVIYSNQSYRILQIEHQRVGAGKPGPKAHDMFDLTRPELNFTDLARGMGVPASRATTAEEFNDQYARALDEPGPALVEVMI